MTKMLGPVPCIGCRKPVYWDSLGVAFAVLTLRESPRKLHACRGRLTQSANPTSKRDAGPGLNTRTPPAA